MKILVTGAAGFIGYHLVDRLLKNNHEVVGIDNLNDYYNVNLKLDRLKELGVREHCQLERLSASEMTSKFKFQKLDLVDLKGLELLFQNEKFDSVVNLAAQAGVRYSLKNPHSYVQSNVVGFVNILECCRHNSIKHLVYASSSSVYGANAKIPFSEDDRVDYPVSLYAATKKSNELMAHTYSHLYNIPTTGLRFFTVYGPWGRPDMAPILFASAINDDKPIKVFNHGDMQRDFTYIDDIVSGIEIVLNNIPKRSENKPPFEINNIGNGNPVSLMDFIKAMENSIGIEAKKNFMDIQPGDVPRTWADTSKLESKGYSSTTPVSEGVEKFIEWYKTYYK